MPGQIDKKSVKFHNKFDMNTRFTVKVMFLTG